MKAVLLLTVFPLFICAMQENNFINNKKTELLEKIRAAPTEEEQIKYMHEYFELECAREEYINYASPETEQPGESFEDLLKKVDLERVRSAAYLEEIPDDTDNKKP